MQLVSKLKGLFQSENPDSPLIRQIFLRSLSLSYFISFISILWQVPGLIGPKGLYPASEGIEWSLQKFGFSGILQFPTLAWINSSAEFLQSTIFVGALLSLFCVIRGARPALLLALWLLQVSIANAANFLMVFGWDYLLLEIGFLAIFFSLKQSPRICKIALQFLLFRLMFTMGFVKLFSSFEAWKDLSFIRHFLQNQPLPTYWAAKLYFLLLELIKLACIVTLAIEVVMPFLVFAPKRFRWARKLSAGSFILLSIAIAIVGNFGLFQVLTVLLALLLFDDSDLQWPMKGIIKKFGRLKLQTDSLPINSIRKNKNVNKILGCVLVSYIFLTSFWVVQVMTREEEIAFNNFAWLSEKETRYIPTSIKNTLRYFAFSWRLTAPYDLFSHVPFQRPQIVIYASENGVDWHELLFKYYLNDIKSAPRFVAPFHPRLDYHLYYFAILERYPEVKSLSPFFSTRFLERLSASLRSSNSETFSLIGDPWLFEHQPKFWKFELYDYEFTEPEHQAEGIWWKREFVKSLAL